MSNCNNLANVAYCKTKMLEREIDKVYRYIDTISGGTVNLEEAKLHVYFDKQISDTIFDSSSPAILGAFETSDWVIAEDSVNGWNPLNGEYTIPYNGVYYANVVMSIFTETGLSPTPSLINVTHYDSDGVTIKNDYAINLDDYKDIYVYSGSTMLTNVVQNDIIKFIFNVLPTTANTVKINGVPTIFPSPMTPVLTQFSLHKIN